MVETPKGIIRNVYSTSYGIKTYKVVVGNKGHNNHASYWIEVLQEVLTSYTRTIVFIFIHEKLYILRYTSSKRCYNANTYGRFTYDIHDSSITDKMENKI